MCRVRLLRIVNVRLVISMIYRVGRSHRRGLRIRGGRRRRSGCCRISRIVGLMGIGVRLINPQPTPHPPTSSKCPTTSANRTSKTTKTSPPSNNATPRPSTKRGMSYRKPSKRSRERVTRRRRLGSIWRRRRGIWDVIRG